MKLVRDKKNSAQVKTVLSLNHPRQGKGHKPYGGLGNMGEFSTLLIFSIQREICFVVHMVLLKCEA